MYLQNPVFIPGPTNMPEILRKAADMPTLDHRSPTRYPPLSSQWDCFMWLAVSSSYMGPRRRFERLSD